MMNGQNWTKLDSDGQFFTSLAIIGEDGRINTSTIRHNLYVPLQSNFFLKKSSNLFKNFRYVRTISPGRDFYDSFYNVLFNKLAKFEITGLKYGNINNCYRIHEDMIDEKKIFEFREDIFTTDTFYGTSHEKTISETKMNELLKLNNYEKAVKDVDFTNLITIKKPSEHSFFLYENQNIIKETFISEIKKRVSLLGGVWYFVKTGSDGKIEIVTSKNKLKFKIKKNESLSRFIFNISPVTAAKKIDFEQRKIKNILILSANTRPANIRKRKMVEILDTIMIKALQSYDNYTVLNPLDVDIRSNYMTEKINNYKGYVYEVCIRNLLFSAGIKNDTQHIFVTCYNLDSAKKL